MRQKLYEILLIPQRFPGEADQVIGANPGDVLLKVDIVSHKVFEREGDNLKASLTISLKEALTGFSRTLTHLDGRKIIVEKKLQVTQPGDVIVIKREGMPKHMYSSERGDLKVKLNIEFPKTLSVQEADCKYKIVQFIVFNQFFNA